MDVSGTAAHFERQLTALCTGISAKFVTARRCGVIEGNSLSRVAISCRTYLRQKTMLGQHSSTNKRSHDLKTYKGVIVWQVHTLCGDSHSFYFDIMRC